jgi:hypothetical protein
MRFSCTLLSLVSMTALNAASPLSPEAPLVAKANKVYQASSAVPPASPSDLLKLAKEGDVSLAFTACTGRWIVDRLALGQMPDDHSIQRMLQDFYWDDAGVLQLQGAGLDGGLLRALASARPLGLSEDARQRLTKAGVDTRVVAALAKKAETNLPPMKSLGDLLMESVSNEPMMQIPGAKDQFAKAMKGVEGKMTSRFKSESFRKEIWESLLENWRSRIQVGSDAKLVLSPVATTIVDGTSEDPGQAAQGMLQMMSSCVQPLSGWDLPRESW